MSLAQSKLTAQGQISVPAKVRRKLGLGPGSILEWEEKGEEIVVRRAGIYKSEDVHRAIFSSLPRTRTLKQLKEGIRASVKVRRAIS